MLTTRPAKTRGLADHGWLRSAHSFSFANYYDPQHMGFRSLRVINEDQVVGGAGFSTHPHRDMEIISYVLAGSLEHKDSMGNGSIMRPGDVQRMTAGTGVLHSEFNHDPHEPVHFLQIWILPEAEGLAPSYEQKTFSEASRHNVLRLVASRDGAKDSVKVHQDIRLYTSLLDAGRSVEHTLQSGRHAWLQVASGTLRVNDVSLAAGDGAKVSEVGTLRLTADNDTHFLLFDLA